MLRLFCKQQLTSKTMLQQSRAPAVNELCFICDLFKRHNCVKAQLYQYNWVSIVQLYEAFTWIASGFCHLLFGTVSILELGLAQVSKDGFADHGKYILQSYLFQVSREEEIS